MAKPRAVTDHTRGIFRWLDQVKADRRLHPTTFLVAYEVAQHVNRTKGIAWPSQAGIAAAIGVCERTVRREIDRLSACGHLDVIEAGNGRNRRNNYRLIVAGAPPTEAKRGTPVSSFGANKEDTDGRSMRTPMSYEQLNEQPREGDCYAIPPPRRESRQAELDLSRDDRAGAAAPPITNEGKVGKPFDHFIRLREIWKRNWPTDDTPQAVEAARREFDRACQRAPPEVILAVAKEHVAAADAPRFLTPLSKWLAASGWTKPPPKRARAGPVREPRGRRKKRTTVDALIDIVNEGRS